MKRRARPEGRGKARRKNKNLPAREGVIIYRQPGGRIYPREKTRPGEKEEEEYTRGEGRASPREKVYSKTRREKKRAR